VERQERVGGHRVPVGERGRVYRRRVGRLAVARREAVVGGVVVGLGVVARGVDSLVGVRRVSLSLTDTAVFGLPVGHVRRVAGRLASGEGVPVPERRRQILDGPLGRVAVVVVAGVEVGVGERPDERRVGREELLVVGVAPVAALGESEESAVVVVVEVLFDRLEGR